MTDALTATQRNVHIDSLRAVAALSVLIAHVLHLKATPFGQLSSIGVLLFFLISGYCIVLSLASLKTKPVMSFFIRRIFRLYPAYWVAVLFGTWLSTETISVKEFLGNLTMLQTALHIKDIVGVFWTLFIEVLFYVFMGALLLFGMAKRIDIYTKSLAVFVMGALAFAILRHFTSITLPFGHLLFLSVFIMGGLVCMAHQQQQSIRWLSMLSIAYLIAILCISYLVFGKAAFQSINIHSFANYAWAMVIFLVVMEERLLAWKWLASLGKISFCIYLFHVPIYNTLALKMQNKPLIFLMTLTLTLFMSAIVYKFIETPCIQLGRRLQRAISARTVSLTTSPATT